MIYFIFLISILLHELGHIITGSLCGYKIKNFVFLPFGACIEFKEHKTQILKNIIIYFSGPMVNFFISYFFILYKIKFSTEIVYTNLILGIFNLLPINPLDGSKILKELLKKFLNNKKCNIISYKLSKFFLVIFSFLYSTFLVKIQNLSILIVLLYLWYIDFKEYKKLQTLLRAYNVIEKTNF